MDPDEAPRRFCGTAVNDAVIDVLERTRVVPVVTIDHADDAVDLATALVDGGLTAIEITLRTPAAFDAIRRIAAHVPDAIVGAGSVTSSAKAAEAIDAGAHFLVSPGLDAGVVDTAHDRGRRVIPGVATATELLRAANLGVDVVKIFPAALVGGPALITALSAVWPAIGFVPTGGVTSTTAADYLALPQVLAVGGSWMVPKSRLDERDWSGVRNGARDAAQLARSHS